MIRFLFGLLLAFFSVKAVAAPSALILISREAAGPNLPTADYFYSDWIRWPEETGADRNNRILSLMSGLDWQGEPGDLRFRSEAGGYRNSNGNSLAQRGYFDTRDRLLNGLNVTVLAGSPPRVSPSALFLGLSQPEEIVATQPLEHLPEEGIVVYEATGWNDATQLANRIGPGRTIVAVYPPAAGEGWSKYFLFGDWPKGKVPVEPLIGVPGLIPARDLVRLLIRPTAFEWQPESAGVWGGANRWLEHGRWAGASILVGWFCLGAIVLLTAFAQVMNEDRGPFTSNLLIQIAATPAVFVAAGALARHGGLEAWPIWLGVSWVLIAGTVATLSYLTRTFWPEFHPLWPVCVVGGATMLLLDPLWSDLSNRFASVDRTVPDAAVGALFGYLSGVSAFSVGRWPGRLIATAMLIWGIAARPWWVADHPELLVLPGIVWVTSEGLFRWPVLAVLALLPTAWFRVRDGLVWSPGGEVRNATDAAGFDLSRHVAFFGSPVFLFTLLTIGFLGLFGNRFLIYRIRKILRADPRLRTLTWAAVATLALGFAEPLAFGAGLIMVFGAAIAIAFDGLRANS